MEKRKYLRLIVLLILLACITWGCNSKKEENPVVTKQEGQKSKASSLSEIPAEVPLPAVASTAAIAKSPAVVVEVNGVKFTEAQLDAEIKRKLAILKDQAPAERLKQMKPEIRKQILDEFVIKTLLSQEVTRLKITATEQEVSEAEERVKAGLPPGATLDDLLKKNDLSKEKFREELRLGVKINKFILSQPLTKAKPAEKQITKYYQDNKEKFKAPETVHARHILVAKSPGDDDKIKADKKAKADLLRKRVVDGADFAEVAAKNSDCPSKSSGGDLGTFSRGQMVKPFEDVAFSQKINAVGPVVETDFGYHIIQVLEHNDPKVINLDKNIREEIAIFLQQQKKQDAFADLLKKLRAKATIIVPGQ